MGLLGKFFGRQTAEIDPPVGVVIKAEPTGQGTTRFTFTPVARELDYAIKKLLIARTTEEAKIAGEEIWAAGEPGILYALTTCYPMSRTCRDAVRDFLNRLLACPSAKHDEFVKLFMLVWCANEDLSKLALELFAIHQKYRDFYDPEAKAAARQVGQRAADLGGIEAMRKLYDALDWLLGTDGAYGLTFAFSHVGGWMA
jgi:hypothetical protein